MRSFLLLLSGVIGDDAFACAWAIRGAPRHNGIRPIQPLGLGLGQRHGNGKSSAVWSNTNDDNDGGGGDIIKSTLGSALTKMREISRKGSTGATFNKRRLGSIEVKESSIGGAGLGLFAKKNIKAGTIISFYPAHSIGIEFEEGSSVDNRKVSIDGSGTINEHKADGENLANQAYIHNILGTRPLMNADISQTLGGESIYIDVDVSMSEDESPSFVSHRINDGATVLNNNEDGALAYYQQSRRAKNCVHVPFGPSPLLATVTTKKVSKGDEFLTTYGCSYWLEHLLKGTEELETDMTEAIVLEAKEVAMDVLKGMQGVARTDANEANALQTIFNDP